jgi:hypothetical protein
MSESPSATPHVGQDHDDPVPNVRPLGYLAVGCGVLSILMAPTFFLSLFALPLGVLALALGLVALSEDSTKKMGAAALVLGVLAVPCAAAFLWMFLQY